MQSLQNLLPTPHLQSETTTFGGKLRQDQQQRRSRLSHVRITGSEKGRRKSDPGYAYQTQGPARGIKHKQLALSLLFNISHFGKETLALLYPLCHFQRYMQQRRSMRLSKRHSIS